MAYSAFESPKLPNQQSKFYYENFDRPVLHRPKTANLPKSSNQSHQAARNPNRKSAKLSAVINKLEENYWANWKPNKEKKPSFIKQQQQQEAPIVNSSTTNAEVEVIKKKPKTKIKMVNANLRKTRNYYTEGDTHSTPRTLVQGRSAHAEDDNKVIEHFVRHKRKVSLEVQTETPTTSSKTPMVVEDIQSTPVEVFEPITTVDSRKSIPVKEEKPNKEEKEENKEIEEKKLNADTEELAEEELKPIKHCDSFILNTIKQVEEADKPHFEQPKCIRLFKKTNSKITRGGSYPLKPCSKPTEGQVKKSNIRLGRPGSPIMVTASLSYRSKF